MTNVADPDASGTNIKTILTMKIKRNGRDEFADIHEPFASPLKVTC